MTSWISLRIEFLGGFISFCVVILAVFGNGIMPPSALAVSLTYCFTIPLLLGLIMNMGAEAEAMMSSVERIKFFSDEVPLEEEEGDFEEVPKNWPAVGNIEARDIKMRYRDGPLVLNGISFDIKGSERVGIAGRTGSGKSSLLVALFRMEKLEEGHLYIDGVDISKVSLKTLRSRLSIIPQDPTVSTNIDTFLTVCF
jgi:ABC-type multidrug transport system fused ATPase/permease subunit